MIPSSSLPYRAELHTDHVIASPSLADFTGIPFVNIGGAGTTYTFRSPLSVNAQNVVRIDLTGYLPKDNPTATGTLSVPKLINGEISGLNTCIASGTGAHAEGFHSTASGNYSHAEGVATTASGKYSHAEGGSTDEGGSTASGYVSHAEGAGTTATGLGSHAEGSTTTAIGEYSHAEGLYSRTFLGADYSHAEGYQSYTSGIYSHAEGTHTQTSGGFSHTEGSSTKTYGDAAHAEGASTMANGNYSHSEGYFTTARTLGSHVAGKYNVLDTTGNATSFGTYAYIIGNGTSENARSNAFTVSWTGNVWCAGDVTDGSGNVLSNKSEVSVSTSSGTSTTEAKYITVDGTEYKLGGGGGGLPIGAIFAYPLSVPPEGAYLLNGQTITNCETLYPDFWDWLDDAVTAGTVRTLTSTQYESEISAYGQCGAFVISGSNVRLPMLNGFIQGVGNGTGTGMTIGAGLPNITGSWSGNRVGISLDPSGFSGALYQIGLAGANRLGAAYNSGTQGIHFGIDASRSNPIYGNSDTVQPPAIKYSYCIQVFNAATELSQQESAQIATSLQGKADANLGNITNTYDYVRRYNIEADGSWVRIWKSGWVEQGGHYDKGSLAIDTSSIISLLIIYTSTNYTLQTNANRNNTATGQINNQSFVCNRTIYDFKARCYGDGASQFVDWYACGQGDPTSIEEYIESL